MPKQKKRWFVALPEYLKATVAVMAKEETRTNVNMVEVLIIRELERRSEKNSK